MSSINSLDMIETEFKLLQNGMGKRYTNIKDSLDKALNTIKSCKGQDTTRLGPQVESLLQPLVLVFETKTTKLFVPALNALQKMASSFMISDSGILTILTMLREASAENVDEITQIKISQILLIFLNPHSLRLSKDFVDLVLQCCFQMFYSKSNSVKSTIQATLRQLFTIVFDLFVHRSKEIVGCEEFFDPKRRINMKNEDVQVCINKLRQIEGEPVFKVITELIISLAQTLSQQGSVDKKGGMMSQQQTAVWNLAPSVSSKCMIMDHISLILAHTGDLFQFFPNILKIFDMEMIPVFEQMFKVKQNEYIVGMRIMKCSILIINNLGIGINLLSHILNETDSLVVKGKDGSFNLNLTWKALIGFECLAIALNNANLIRTFASSALQVNKTVLVQVFETLIQASENLDLSGELNQKHMLNPTFLHQKTPKFIDAQILENEMAPPQPIQIHKLIIESICSFVENLIILFDHSGIKIGSQQLKASFQQDSSIKQEPKKKQMDCKDLLMLAWKPLLNTLQNLLRLTNDESNIQILLNCYQNFISVCGSVHCFEARDGFLESLCSFCLTPPSGQQRPQDASSSQQQNQYKQQQQPQQQGEVQLNEKNIQICKTLLNIAHCLGYILDVKSWYIILETMQKIETVIKQKLKSKGKGIQQSNLPGINQSGNQTLVDFNEIKNKVQEKMKDHSIVEQSRKESGLSLVNLSKEEEKKNGGGILDSNSLGGLKDNPFTSMAVSEYGDDVNSAGKKQSPSKKITHARSGSQAKNAAENQIAPDSRLQLSQYESTQASHHNYDPLLTDLQILQDSFDSLFTSSLLFDQQSLAELITSLGQLTVGVLENINPKKSNIADKTVKGATSKHQPAEGEILANVNTFAITRLVETALVNISRIELIWKILVAHFDILSNCKIQTLRQLSIEALLCIILEIFQYKKNSKPYIGDKRSSMAAVNQTPSRMGQKQRMASLQSSGSVNDMEEDLDIDVDENWSGTIWQYTILTPFSDQLKSQHQSNKLQTLKGIEKIIQTCGQQIKNDGWRIIIITMSKTPELDNEQIVGTGFKCLKLIVSNYIDKLSQENFITILHAIDKYAANNGDNINNNLTAVGLLQNIADFIAKQTQREGGGNIQASQINNNNEQIPQLNSERIWSILFEKIQELGSDFRVEIRRANIYTLENILMAHGNILSQTIWLQILQNVLLNLFKNSVDIYSQQKGGPQQKAVVNMEMGLPTPSFSMAPKDTKKNGQQKQRMAFDDKTVMQSLQKNSDEQWEETCLLLAQTVIRSIKKYIQLEKRSDEAINQMWSKCVSILNDLIKCGSQEICTTIYKTLEDFLQTSDCVDLFMFNTGQSFEIFSSTSDWLSQEKQETGGIIRKPMNLKLCPIIIDCLRRIYTQNSSSQQDQQDDVEPTMRHKQIVNPNFMTTILSLLFKMMRCSKGSGEGFQGMGVPHKLMTEERVTFDFIEELNDIVKVHTQSHLLYLKFLLSFTEYDIQEPHSEAFIRRTFSIIDSLIIQDKIPTEILKEILPPLYDRIEYLISLRYNNEACMGLVFPAKGSSTLFYTVGLYAMHFSSFLINPKHFKARMMAHFKQTEEQKRGGSHNFALGGGSSIGGTSTLVQGGTGGYTGGLKAKNSLTMGGSIIGSSSSAQPDDFMASSNDIMFAEQLEFPVIDPLKMQSTNWNNSELKQLVWERVIPLAKNHLLFNPERVNSHNKAVVEDVVKSSQDLDMQVMNFITNSLLPNCGDINDKDFHQNLVAIIDNGCNSVYNTQKLSQGGSNNSTFGNTLSKYCLNNLFELCRFQPLRLNNEEEQINEMSDQNERKIYEIRKKIATITTPVLINRCRDTLKKFAHDEQKSGSMSLPRQRINEAVFILEKLRQLDCYPEVSPQQYKSKKDHLVSLMPIFADLVLSNESALKEYLKLIFLDISDAITKPNNNQHAVGDSSGGEF